MPLRRLSSWTTFFVGVVLGMVLTFTFTFQLWVCSSSEENIKSISLLTLPEKRRVGQQCVCGQDLESLEHELGHKNASKIHSLPVMQPAIHNTTNEQVSSVGESSKSVFKEKSTLLVAVISKKPEWMESVYNTWGRDATHLLFFVGSNFNFSHPSAVGLPLVRLGSSSQPVASSVRSTLSILKYLSEHFLESHQWFLLAMEDSYVRIDKLEMLLIQLNPAEKVYLGRWASGNKEDIDRLGLWSHERYCLGNSGIILSSALVSELSGHIEECDEAGLPGDVSLGKCISRTTNIQCTSSELVRLLLTIINHFYELTMYFCRLETTSLRTTVAFHSQLSCWIRRHFPWLVIIL